MKGGKEGRATLTQSWLPRHISRTVTGMSPTKSQIQGHVTKSSLVRTRTHRPELRPHQPAFLGAALCLAQPGPQPSLAPAALLAAMPPPDPSGPYCTVRPSLSFRCWSHWLESGWKAVFHLPRPTLKYIRTVCDPTWWGALCSDKGQPPDRADE